MWNLCSSGGEIIAFEIWTSRVPERTHLHHFRHICSQHAFYKRFLAVIIRFWHSSGYVWCPFRALQAYSWAAFSWSDCESSGESSSESSIEFPVSPKAGPKVRPKSETQQWDPKWDYKSVPSEYPTWRPSVYQSETQVRPKVQPKMKPESETQRLSETKVCQMIS